MLLYVTRKHPPSIGGMQRQSYELAAELRKLVDARVISWGRSQTLLPVFLLYALVSTQLLLCRKRTLVDSVHLGDTVLSPLGLALRYLFGVPVSVNTHGLDVIFPSKLYQALVIPCLRKLDLVICNSDATRVECLNRGVPADKCVVIPIGVRKVDRVGSKIEARDSLSEFVGKDLNERKIVLTVGRLVKRKGAANFVARILPQIVAIDPRVLYLVLGDGPQRREIQQNTKMKNLESHVVLTGEVDDHILATAYLASDLFVMPNLHVPGDIEGFGIVALEASSAGLCVVATEVDGIPSAIIHEANGFLVKPDEPGVLSQTIIELLANDEQREALAGKFRDFTQAHFEWPIIAQHYVREFETLKRRVGPLQSTCS